MNIIIKSCGFPIQTRESMQVCNKIRRMSHHQSINILKSSCASIKKTNSVAFVKNGTFHTVFIQIIKSESRTTNDSELEYLVASSSSPWWSSVVSWGKLSQHTISYISFRLLVFLILRVVIIILTYMWLCGWMVPTQLVDVVVVVV